MRTVNQKLGMLEMMSALFWKCGCRSLLYFCSTCKAHQQFVLLGKKPFFVFLIQWYLDDFVTGTFVEFVYFILDFIDSLDRFLLLLFCDDDHY